MPDATNTQAFNRYMYVYGNPIRYNDPTGNEGVYGPGAWAGYPIGNTGLTTGAGGVSTGPDGQPSNPKTITGADSPAKTDSNAPNQDINNDGEDSKTAEGEIIKDLMDKDSKEFKARLEKLLKQYEKVTIEKVNDITIFPGIKLTIKTGTTYEGTGDEGNITIDIGDSPSVTLSKSGRLGPITGEITDPIHRASEGTLEISNGDGSKSLILSIGPDGYTVGGQTNGEGGVFGQASLSVNPILPAALAAVSLFFGPQNAQRALQYAPGQ
jgi:hypothetical protein